MNTHLLFNELRDLQRKVREQREDNLDILYNQMTLSDHLNLSSLRNIIKEDFTNEETIDENRTTADLVDLGYTSLDGTEKVLITNDYSLDGQYGDFTFFSYKDDPNLNIRILLSNENIGEFFVEAVKTGEREVAGLIEETFKVSKGRGSRVRLKVVLDKVDDLRNEGTLMKLNAIYQ